MKIFYFLAGATVFSYLDMPTATMAWIFLAGTVYENQRIRSLPHLIVGDNSWTGN